MPVKSAILSFLPYIFPLFLPCAVLAAEQPVWVEAAGEAQMGELDTQTEVKARARRDAQIKALEQAVGTFIRSHTLVANYQVADDLIYAAVRGRIDRMEVLSEGWDGKDRTLYRARIKALVEPVYPEKGQGLALKVALSKSVLKEGQATKILYQANSDCHVYIFSIASDGSVTLLLPNAATRDNRVISGKAYEFPPADGPVRLEAMFLPGFTGNEAEERIKVIATRKEEALIPLGFREGMLKVYDAGSTGMVNDLVRKLNQLEPADWTEATAVYKIVR
jgi:hypothetical protein